MNVLNTTWKEVNKDRGDSMNISQLYNMEIAYLLCFQCYLAKFGGRTMHTTPWLKMALGAKFQEEGEEVHSSAHILSLLSYCS